MQENIQINKSVHEGWDIIDSLILLREAREAMDIGDNVLADEYLDCMENGLKKLIVSVN